MTYAKVIADSTFENGTRLTTMEIKLHRFVLAELNTHRVFSRNSASSRAIPVSKQLQRIRDNLAMPVVWPKEQKGMQGGETHDDETVERLTDLWYSAAADVCDLAQFLHESHKLHKSVTNRLLEPFMWHTVVITATAWDNFFLQRCSPLAQPEIRLAAQLAYEAMNESEPLELLEGMWHLPYITNADDLELSDIIKVSAARCARVSYLTQDGTRDTSADLALYDRLVSADPKHWSPLEHPATPWPANKQDGALEIQTEEGDTISVPLDHLPKTGNLLQWRSLRTTVEAEMKVLTYV